MPAPMGEASQPAAQPPSPAEMPPVEQPPAPAEQLPPAMEVDTGPPTAGSQAGVLDMDSLLGGAGGGGGKVLPPPAAGAAVLPPPAAPAVGGFDLLGDWLAEAPPAAQQVAVAALPPPGTGAAAEGADLSDLFDVLGLSGPPAQLAGAVVPTETEAAAAAAAGEAASALQLEREQEQAVPASQLESGTDLGGLSDVSTDAASEAGEEPEVQPWEPLPSLPAAPASLPLPAEQQQQQQQPETTQREQPKQQGMQQQPEAQQQQPQPQQSPEGSPQPEQQETLLQAAERLERRLAVGGGGAAAAAAQAGSAAEADAAYRDDLLLAGLMSQVGRLLRLVRGSLAFHHQLLHRRHAHLRPAMCSLQLEPEAAAAAAASGGGSGGGDGTVLGRLAAARAFLSPNFESLFRGPQPAGQPTCVAKYLGIAAVGTSGGAAYVLLPGAPGLAGGKQAQAQQPPRCVHGEAWGRAGRGQDACGLRAGT